MASVEFEHVEKVFGGGTRAVADLTLRVADGELLVLVGPSGCGKSTLLRLVAGLEEATSGTIRIGDAVVNARSPRERNVAMVFQDYALYPHMSVRENLEFPLRMRRLARAEMRQRVAWAVETLGLEGVLERRPRELSGGQQQRVAMGRALVREPAVFLLDEPLSNLDAKLRVEVRAEIAELQRRLRATMLYVTHDQTEAMTLGDRVAVLQGGQLLQVAPPRELYDCPANAFVAGFIGNPAMNLLPARLVPSDSGAAPDLALEIAGSRLSLAGLLAAGIALPRQPGRVTAGIRPEALRLVEHDAGGGGSSLAGEIEHLEWLGHETLVYVALLGPGDGERPRVVARIPGMRELARGRTVSLAPAPGSLHLFPET